MRQWPGYDLWPTWIGYLSTRSVGSLPLLLLHDQFRPFAFHFSFYENMNSPEFRVTPDFLAHDSGLIVNLFV
jgi:hypothetical protein